MKVMFFWEGQKISLALLSSLRTANKMGGTSQAKYTPLYKNGIKKVRIKSMETALLRKFACYFSIGNQAQNLRGTNSTIERQKFCKEKTLVV